jgi:hypothetical protein
MNKHFHSLHFYQNIWTYYPAYELHFQKKAASSEAAFLNI